MNRTLSTLVWLTLGRVFLLNRELLLCLKKLRIVLISIKVIRPFYFTLGRGPSWGTAFLGHLDPKLIRPRISIIHRSKTPDNFVLNYLDLSCWLWYIFECYAANPAERLQEASSFMLIDINPISRVKKKLGSFLLNI